LGRVADRGGSAHSGRCFARWVGGVPMSFAQYLEGTKEVLAGNLPIAVGGGVAVVVLSAVFLLSLPRRRRRRRGLDAAVLNPPTPNAMVDEKALEWTPPEQSYADRRGAVRRDGMPVRILISSPTFRN